MPNCLADNITGHSCDPYVFLRDIRLYLFYIANILVKRVPVPGSVPVTGSQLAHPNSITRTPWRIFHHLFYNCSG